MQALKIDLDGPVHYVDFGGSGPTMLLVHGPGGAHLDWLQAGTRLARRARVLALDLAGLGPMPLGEEPAGMPALQALLDRFLRALCPEPVLLVGSSRGTALCLQQAARAPERVAGLVLVSPAQPRRRGLAPHGCSRSLVRQVAAPTLLLQGTEDRLVLMRGSRALARLRPDWCYVEFPGVGHVPMAECPDAFVATVHTWWSSLGPLAAPAPTSPFRRSRRRVSGRA